MSTQDINFSWASALKQAALIGAGTAGASYIMFGKVSLMTSIGTAAGALVLPLLMTLANATSYSTTLVAFGLVLAFIGPTVGMYVGARYGGEPFGWKLWALSIPITWGAQLVGAFLPF
jgi:hypothetical protein